MDLRGPATAGQAAAGPLAGFQRIVTAPNTAPPSPAGPVVTNSSRKSTNVNITINQTVTLETPTTVTVDNLEERIEAALETANQRLSRELNQSLTDVF